MSEDSACKRDNTKISPEDLKEDLKKEKEKELHNVVDSTANFIKTIFPYIWGAVMSTIWIAGKFKRKKK